MKRSFFLLTMLLLLSCKRESKFDLEKDLYQFSRKMENGDSLEVRVNHSACIFVAFENYTFIKENDTLYVETLSEISSFKKQQQSLSKIPYSINPKDSLSFDFFFKYMERENKSARKNYPPIVTVYYRNKSQTKYFNDEGLKDKFEKLDKLLSVRAKLYPNDHFFEFPEPTPPPRLLEK